MSEHLRPSHESHESNKPPEILDLSEEVKKNLERLDTEAEKDTSDIESLAVSAKETAISGHETIADMSESTRQTQSYASRADLKRDAYGRIVRDIQSRLSTPEKTLSRFVHKPIVEAVSEVTSKTIARPTGIATGGSIALLGMMLTLFLAYRYGFTYNYLLFGLLFVGGYIAGTIIELVATYIKRLKGHS
ncbi:hypothetical protein BH23PAT2_BH23PAT2_07060 [soil metagenome]